MPKAFAKSKYVRISPRKARLAANMIRGKSVIEASLQLSYSNLKAGRLLLKTLASAIANAENNADGNREDLYISEIRVDEGAHLKRRWARSKGKGLPILRRTSHFYIAVDSNANREKGK